MPRSTAAKIRWLAAALALPLAALWLVALVRHGPVWLTWLDAIAALFAFGSIGLTPDGKWAGLVGGACLLAVGGGLALLWLLGLATGAPAWLVWWNLGLGCAFLLAAVAPLLDWLFALRLLPIADRT
jgi:hypothetical protein